MQGCDRSPGSHPLATPCSDLGPAKRRAVPRHAHGKHTGMAAPDGADRASRPLRGEPTHPDDHARALATIAAAGRATRTPTPRWLWGIAAIVGGICSVGFALMVLGGEGAPIHRVAPATNSQSGLGIGLVIGIGVGVVIGFSIGRHRGGHSSRNSP